MTRICIRCGEEKPKDKIGPDNICHTCIDVRKKNGKKNHNKER